MLDSRENVRMKRAVLFLLLVWSMSPTLATCQTTEEQVELSFRAGQEAMKQGQFVHAAEEFKKVLTLDPSLIEAEVNLGLAYQSLSEYDLAVRHLTKALRERPNLLGATVIVGMDSAQRSKAWPILPLAPAMIILVMTQHPALDEG